MSRISSIVVSTGLIGAGAFAWAIAGRPLIANPELAVPLNPLGINRSPYGEVIAMAMQGPVDTYFNAAMFSGPHPPENNQDDQAGKPQEPKGEPADAAADSKPSLNTRLDAFVASLAKVAETRTNPKGASTALKRHLRRQAEDKLRFAYQLDPAHYANYNALHFFLTEPELGTRPELTPTAAKLAEDTIQYCLKLDHDPRPALTAAAAATNILHLMFADSRSETPKYNTAQMRQCLNLLDHCLARYQLVAQEWDLANQWELLSPQRIDECAQHLSFICKIRDAAEQTIIRLEQKNLPPQAAN
jgi:hypothetical protein